MRPAVRRGVRAFRPGHGAWSLVLLCVAATAGGAPPGARSQGEAPGWVGLPIPGGPAALLDAAGLDRTRPRTTALLDVIHVIYQARPGVEAEVDERRARVLSYLETLDGRRSTGDAADQGGGSDLVPLPLPEGVWRVLTRTARTSSKSLVRAILEDRNASLLYYGLCSVDADTRRWLAARPALVERLYAAHRAPLAALFARAVRVRDNRIDPPGGAAAGALWESVAGESLDQPDLFIPAVLSRDAGRLALLYDAVAHMDTPRQRFALGLWIDEPERRLARFRTLYAACARGLSGWHPQERPFARVLYDPAHLLLNARVGPDGRPGPLDWRLFWERALAGGASARLEGPPTDIEREGVLDAAALLEVVYTRRPSFLRDIAEAWCFGERVFGGAPRTSLPDVLVAVRGFCRYRSLVLTLERVGIDDPAIYAAAIDRAERIARIDDRDRAVTALSLYQGALALVERSRLARSVDAETARCLVESLARLPVSPGGADEGGVASWIDARLLPALGPAVVGPADASRPAELHDAELRLLEAFAGRRHEASPPRTIDYEGTRYRVDPVGVKLATIQAVRERQRGVSLDAALAFSREVRAPLDASAHQDTTARVARLVQAAAPALAPSGSRPSSKAGAALRNSMTEAARDLEAVRKAGDLRSVEMRRAKLAPVADQVLGQVLVSLAYAAALPNPNSTALMAGDPSLEHDWGLSFGEPAPSGFSWALPADSRDATGRWRVRGSLLALDLCLGVEALRRLSADSLPAPPTISDDDRRAFTEAALLANASDYRDEDMRRVSGAIWRGRLRLASLALDPLALPPIVAAAGLDETRQELLSWTVVHEPDRLPEFFSLAECLRLGAASGPPLPALEVWGASGLSYDGRLSLRFPTSQPFATLAGRRTRGLLGALVPDLSLLVATMLDEHRLPAALAHPVLLVATRDYLDRLALAYNDDWMTLVAGVQRLVPSRLDDYLASVTTAGPLVVLPPANENKRP